MTDTPKQVTCAACGQPLPLSSAVSLPAQPVKRNGGGYEVGTLYYHPEHKPTTKEAKR